MTPAVTNAEQAARACLQDITSESAQVLAAVLERWNGLTPTQQGRVFALVEQLHRATAIKRATRTMLTGGAR